VTHKNL